MNRDNVISLYESKFIKLYDLQYEEGKHYFDATRRSADDVVAIKSTEEFKRMLPDAVSCFVILDGEEPRLLLSWEYRYPAGQYLLSPPAGLIDPEDRDCDEPLIRTAIREIKEETGIDVDGHDRVSVVNPLVFSTPGMTDESNGLVCAVLKDKDEGCLTHAGAVGTERFEGFLLADRDKARSLLKNGRDDDGIFYSVYTWMALMYFVSDMWK